MNTAPLTVQRKMLASRVHRTFVTLGMRHLCVVNHANRIVGIITRKDLEHAAEAGHHGHHTPQAPELTASRSIVASSSGVRLQLPDGRRHRRPLRSLEPVGEVDVEQAEGSSHTDTTGVDRDENTVEIDVDSLIHDGEGHKKGTDEQEQS